MTYLEKAIQIQGKDVIALDYHSMSIKEFCFKYNTCYASCTGLFGFKKKGNPIISEKNRFPCHSPNIRDGINTEKWEQQKQERYWEKEGFEIRETKYLKTSLL